MPRSVFVAIVSAGIFWAGFVFCLVSFCTDPQTPIALGLSPIYAVFVGVPAGIIDASISAIRRKSRGRIFAFVALPTATVFLLGYAWLFVAEVIRSFGDGANR
jgi:hypothetical protein